MPHMESKETVLKLTDQTLKLAQGDMVLDIPLSPETLTRQYFHHAIPTPVELECAIQEVEDALHPAYGKISGGTLVIDGQELYGVPDFIAFAQDLSVTRDTLEDGFLRLAALSEGRPVTQDPVPGNGNFPAFLLILRELMHHLNFSDLRIKS